MSAFLVSTGLYVEHRRPKAGSLGFWGLGVQGFRSFGFKATNNTMQNNNTQRSKPTLAIVVRPTLAKPTLAKVWVSVECEDFGFSESIVWFFLKLIVKVFLCVLR